MNWELIACISGFLNHMEGHSDWDLSSGECATLIESFYHSLYGGLPRDRKEWEMIFEEARVATWGKDHTCKPVLDSDISTLALYLPDSFFGSDVKMYSSYLERIGVV